MARALGDFRHEGEGMDKTTNRKGQALSLVRHALTFGAGLLVAKGKLDPTEAESLVGGVMAIGSGLWGYHDPHKKGVKPCQKLR